MSKFKGKVAFVTGAAQGIGKAIAVALAKEGADIVVSDINLELATQTSQEVQALGVKSMALKSNVAEFCDVEEGVKQALAQMGKIDILVNNAGITKDTLLIRMKKEDWDAVINVNLNGVFNCTRVIAPLMMKQGSGRIINIASIVGEMGNVGQVNYASSKAGVIGLTKTVARELATRGVTVNAIAPGFIKTAMTDKIPENVKEQMLKQIPMAKLGMPEDIAYAVVFLASDDAAYITGQVLNVNGGMLMNT